MGYACLLVVKLVLGRMSQQRPKMTPQALGSAVLFKKGSRDQLLLSAGISYIPRASVVTSGAQAVGSAFPLGMGLRAEQLGAVWAA